MVLVNIDGALVPPAEARISVFDRGFLYGDSVYEVIRTYGGKPFELDRHLARLAHSAERIGLELPWEAERTAAEIDRTLQGVARSTEEDEPGAAPWNRGERYIRIVMTRGAGEIGLDPALAEDPRSIVIVRPIHGPPLEAYTSGVAGMVVGVQRNSPLAVDPSAKTGNYLNNVLAIREARAAGAFESFMLDSAGFVTEGSSSNIFVVKGGAIVTPPVAAGILEGVTRGVVLGLARSLGIRATEEAMRPDVLEKADEIFITSSIREIVPIVRLILAPARGGSPAERPVGTGQVGMVTARLHDEFRRRAGGPEVPRRAF